jgi:hypothetical protein
MENQEKAFAFEWSGIQHKVPVMQESMTNKYVTYGLENEYPYYLLDMYRRSAKHNAIINGKVNYICGDGWVFDQNASILAKAQAQKFIEYVNDEETLNDLTEKLVMDLELYNGFAVAVTWAKNKTIYSIEHISFEKVRASSDFSCYYVADWYTPEGNRRVPNQNKIKTYYPFDEQKRSGTQLFYYRVYTPGMMTYPLPEYLGSLAWIEADVEVANFHNNNLRNNFWGGYLINFPNGIPSKEKQKDIEREIKRKWGGTDNAGRFMVNFSDDPSRKPTLDPLTPSTMDRQFEMLNETIQAEIFVGHRVTSPMLFGVRVDGQLGGRSELIEAYEIFKSVYISDRQRKVERIINWFASYNKCAKLTLAEKPPIFERWSEQALLTIMTDDEKREKAGLEPLSKANGTGDAINPDEQSVPVSANEHIKKLSGREHQNLARIIRQYGQGKLTEAQAKTMLKVGFGLSDEDIAQMLSDVTPTGFDSEVGDNASLLFASASGLGIPAEEFYCLSSDAFVYDPANSEEEIDASAMSFGNHSLQKHLAFRIEESKLDAYILKMYKDNPDAEAKDVAKASGWSLKKVSSRIQSLISDGKLKVNERIRENTKIEPQPEEKLEVRYKYAWSPEFTNPDKLEATSREFCKTMLGLDRLYTREDINTLSRIMGYSVWNRRGGWYTTPGGKPRPQCRHIWLQQIVVHKGNEIFLP